MTKRNNKLWLGLGLATGGLVGLYLWQRERYRRSLPPLHPGREVRPLALITGASSGIGADYAAQLAAAGYDLLLVARREARLQALAATLTEQHGIACEVFAADLADEADVDGLVAHIEALPRLDFLVNNAGFGTKGHFSEVALASHVAMIDVHIVAAVWLTRAALPGMIARGRGAVVNVASVAGFYPLPGNATYSATKRYLITFTEALHQEIHGTGVRVQALCPGFTRTEFHEQSKEPVAGLPDFVWLSAEGVAAHSLRDLERGVVVSVPGWLYQVLAWASRWLPYPLIMLGSSWLQEQRAKKPGGAFLDDFPKRTYGSLAELRSDLRFMRKHRAAIAKAMRQIPEDFRERLMLAVTQVNGCRYCANYHAKAALTEGLSAEEVAALLDGVVEVCPEAQIPAVFYAQHWADTGGQPDPEARAQLVAAYGEEEVQHIEALLRVISMANYMGNALDYALYRLSGGRWGV